MHFKKGALIIVSNSDIQLIKGMENFRMLNTGLLSISRMHKPV